MIHFNRLPVALLASTVLFSALLLTPLAAFAQDDSESMDEMMMEMMMMGGLTPELLADSLLHDNNGSGALEIDAYGDSITRGRGDFIGTGSEQVFMTPAPVGEAGYPLRVELLLNVSVANRGGLGQRVTESILERFAAEVPTNRPDITIIGGGSNDALNGVSDREVFDAFQIMVNIARAVGTTPVLLTLPPTCCERIGFDFFVKTYSSRIREIVSINEVDLADIRKGFDNTCQFPQCEFLNRPEGLHPNAEGYDIMGEVVIAELLSIDLFSATGPAELEQALLLPAGTVKTIPDVIIVPELPTTETTETAESA